jgi:Glycosyltransferase family 87
MVGLILVITGIFFATQLWIRCSKNFAWDFAINWTATKGLESGFSLYDRPNLRSLGQSLIGPDMNSSFSDIFNSYIGLPTTALLFIPFSFWAFPISLAVYRSFSFMAFVLAIYFAGLSLPADNRKLGWVLGLVALFISDAVVISLQLGQVDAWVTLALAIGLWLASKDKWGWAGVGIGIATLLKISPGFIIVYCVLRRKFSTAITACVTIGVGLILAMLIGKPSDLGRFALEVLPSLSSASLHTQNQSLIAWLARIFLAETNFLVYSNGIGIFRILSIPLAGGLMLALWVGLRKRALNYFELGLLIIICLLIGPITWDHYTAWAIITIVGVADAKLWTAWQGKQRLELFAILGMSLILLNMPILYFLPATIASQWTLRLATGTKTLGLIILLGVETALLIQSSTVQGETKQDSGIRPVRE